MLSHSVLMSNTLIVGVMQCYALVWLVQHLSADWKACLFVFYSFISLIITVVYVYFSAFWGRCMLMWQAFTGYSFLEFQKYFCMDSSCYGNMVVSVSPLFTNSQANLHKYVAKPVMNSWHYLFKFSYLLFIYSTSRPTVISLFENSNIAFFKEQIYLSFIRPLHWLWHN